MDIIEADFKLFERSEFSFKKLKAEKSVDEIEELKAIYQQHWQKWKSLNLSVIEQLADPNFVKPKVESWTNGWNLRNHFWSAYRASHRKKEATCLATLLNKKQFQVYLMYQHYKSDEHYRTKEAYNQLLDNLPSWSKNRDLQHYYIWDNQESELQDHQPLAEFLTDSANMLRFKQQLAANDSTFQLGVLFFAPDSILSADEKASFYLQELAELYQQLAK